VQANLNRSFGYLQQLSDRGLRHVLSVAQHQQRSIALVEALESGMEVGALDGGNDLLVVGALLRFDRGDRLGTNAGTLTEGLVADDRRQPLVAALVLAQGRFTAPGTEQGVLGDVLGLARVAGVAIGDPKADPVCFPPLPTIAGIMAIGWWSVDFLKVLRQKPDDPT
jgi:hypothetical protein